MTDVREIRCELKSDTFTWEENAQEVKTWAIFQEEKISQWRNTSPTLASTCHANSLCPINPLQSLEPFRMEIWEEKISLSFLMTGLASGCFLTSDKH